MSKNLTQSKTHGKVYSKGRKGEKRVKKMLTKGKDGDKILLLSRDAEAERQEHEGNAKRA